MASVRDRDALYLLRVEELSDTKKRKISKSLHYGRGDVNIHDDSSPCWYWRILTKKYNTQVFLTLMNEEINGCATRLKGHFWHFCARPFGHFLIVTTAEKSFGFWCDEKERTLFSSIGTSWVVHSSTKKWDTLPSHLTLLSTNYNILRPSWGKCDHPSVHLVFQLNPLIYRLVLSLCFRFVDADRALRLVNQLHQAPKQHQNLLLKNKQLVTNQQPNKCLPKHPRSRALPRLKHQQ